MTLASYPVGTVVDGLIGVGGKSLGYLDGGGVKATSAEAGVDVVPAYAKVSTVGVAGSVDAPHVDLAMPPFPPAVVDGGVVKVPAKGGLAWGGGSVSWTHTISNTGWAAIATAITPPSFGYSYGGDIYADAGNGYSGGGSLGDMRVPEGLCGNCRRDWHEVPLTEAVARMWDSVAFDETYDPATDVSRIVCPGSECCGPVINYRRASSYSYPGTNSAWIDISVDVSPLSKMVSNLESIFSSFHHVFDPSLWLPSPAPDLSSWQWFDEAHQSVDGFDTDKLFADLKELGSFTWSPYEAAPMLAALEAAPKTVDTAHKPPVSPGFDFSDFKLDSYQPPKGKKKK